MRLCVAFTYVISCDYSYNDHRNMVGNVTYYETLKFLQENICPSGACHSWTRSVDLNIEHVRWY